MRRVWCRFLAAFRLDLTAVCEESRDGRDYHDYPDSETPLPMPFHTYRCIRCGKEFTI